MRTSCRVFAMFLAAALPSAWLAAENEGPALSSPRGVATESIDTPNASEQLAAVATKYRYVGTASCASANCHGGDGSRPVRASGDPYSPQAYSIWIQRDPHAGSYEVLYSAESQQIAARLGLENAYSSNVCLNCHAVNADKSQLTPTARHTLHDGVGCEACHGAAEAWLDPHKWDAWSTKSAAEKLALGYRDIGDVVERAKMCAECHVGSEARDVNHDLIAAGHPRMMFELSAYHANLPKHWKDRTVAADELDARLWLVGQAVSAQSSLAQLSRRAADSKAPWPELSEYECFACHHDLADPSWRQEEFAAGASPGPGVARWASWHMALLPLAPPAIEDPAKERLEQLQREMQRPLPQRALVTQVALEASRDLEAFARASAREPMALADRIAWVHRLARAPQSASLNWDDAAQRYLGCAALSYAAKDAAVPGGSIPTEQWRRIESSLTQLREALQFPKGFQSPRVDAPAAVRSSRSQVRETFDEIYRLTAPPQTSSETRER